MANVKKLGFWTIVALTITSMLGTGLFRGVQLASLEAGSASIWAWIVLALVTIYVAYVFGELVALFPRAGGTYEFAKRAYGRFPSFLVGWVTWIVANLTTSVLIVTAVDFVIPAQSSLVKLGLSILIIVLFNYVTFRGIEASGIVLLFFAGIALVLLLGLLVPGFFITDTNFFESAFSFSPLVVFVAVFFIAETFFGWESASFLAEETEKPEKVIPRALVISTVVVVLIGVCFAAVLMGSFAPSALFASASPALDLAHMIYGSASLGIVRWLVFLTLIGSAAGAVVSSPRLLLALGRDRLFPDVFSHVHMKYRTPDKAIFFQTLVSILVMLIAFGKYQILLSMLVPMALLMYISVIIIVPILRKKMPGKRVFKAPLGTVLPWIVALFYLGVIVAWLAQPGSWSLFGLMLSFIAFAIPLYVLISFFYDPDALRQMTNALAGVSYLLEEFVVGRKLRNRILSVYRDLSGKQVVELGAGVGTLTIPLAERVGASGKVIAIDFSQGNLDILAKRVRRARLKNVEIVHDEHAVSRVHPDVRRVDLAYSVGHLGYVQDPERYLRELAAVLPEGGKICFVEFTHFFGFIPNKAWLDDTAQIKRMFLQAGFSVAVQRFPSGLWQAVLVYGVRSRKPQIVV